MNGLKKVNVAFSNKCNLACPFCLCNKYRSDRDELTVAQWLDFIDELSENKVFHIGIWGGEPFFMPELRTIIDRIVAGRMRFHLITNGSCIDKDLLRYIADRGRCDYIQFSLDGLEDIHDAGRGKGVFQKVVQSIRFAAELKMKVSVNSVISHGNLHQALELAYFLESLDICTYRLNLINDSKLTLPSDYRALTLDEFTDMIAEFAPHFDALKKLHSASPVKRYYLQLTNPHPDSDQYQFCRAPLYELTVFSDGRVVPCSRAENITLGYANVDSLDDMWNKVELRDFWQQLSGGSERNHSYCQDCQYRYYCRKFCPCSTAEYYCRKKIADLLCQKGILS